MEGETSFSEHSLQLSPLLPSVLHRLTHSTTLWENKHKTHKNSSQLFWSELNYISQKLDKNEHLCTINEDNAWQEPQLLVSILTQTLKCINKNKMGQKTNLECLQFIIDTSYITGIYWK